jgi:ribonuclease J
MPAPVRLVFLGGLGEIGRNCFCLEVDGRILVVDCGLMFPDADMPGVDLVLPDFTYLRDNADRVEGVVLTHGHEDHVGGLAYLLRDVSAPVFGSALCLGLARNRIEEAGLLGRTELVAVRDGDRIDIGPFDVEFVPIAHSVPHAFATVFRTPAGTILHTGDFKIDLTPFDGRQTDLPRLGQIAGEGVTLLLSDSTNAEKPGFTPSETTVGPVIHDILRDHPDRRVIVAAFSSHLHRVAQVVQAARACGRKVAFVGRSMLQNVALARSLGLLDLPEAEVVDIEEVARLAPGSVCVVGTGSQGEPMSALALMAAQEHKHLRIGPDDVVVISAHAIPGNEHNVARVIDSLHRAGADVIHEKTAPVHVSGHAAQEELKFMLSLVRPRWFVPVHGEFRHLVHHARLAHAVGVPEDRVVLCTDGDVLTIEAGDLEVARRAVPAGYQYVDGVLDDISVGVLRDRKTLAAEGVVVVIVTVDAASGDLVTGPEIVTRGWIHEAEASDLLDEARAEVRAALARAAADGATDPEAVRRHARRALGRFINARTRRRPAIVPVVLEV